MSSSALNPAWFSLCIQTFGISLECLCIQKAPAPGQMMGSALKGHQKSLGLTKAQEVFAEGTQGHQELSCGSLPCVSVPRCGLCAVPRSSFVPVSQRHRSCLVALQDGAVPATASSDPRAVPEEFFLQISPAHSHGAAMWKEHMMPLTCHPQTIPDTGGAVPRQHPSRATRALGGHFRSSLFGDILSQRTESP